VLSRVEGVDTLGRRVRRTAEGIHRAVERMTRLIEDLVDWGTIQAGKLSINLAVHEAEDLLDEAVELFRPVARDRRIELGTEARGELGDVVCDRDRILQALSNLLSNALKLVAPGGHVVVGAERRPGELLVFVADTGPGIPAESLGNLFERYWRGHEPGYKGTGLGLAITKGIVEAHGGRIWVESTVGQGTAFHFTLPERQGEPPDTECSRGS
jgi:signal transduction histidine kinase